MEKEPLAKRLGKNIAKRRKELGLTQAALAELLSIEPESVSRCERGMATPSLGSLEQFARVLETTIADLLDEFPGKAYPDVVRLSALISELPSESRILVMEIAERLSGFLRSAP